MVPILFSDNHLLAVNKPGGMLTQADGSGAENLEDLCRDWVKKEKNKSGSVFLHAVHRLDRPASGVVLLARTSKALERMNTFLREREVEKTYHAVLEGGPADDEGRLENFLLHDDFRASVVDAGRGKLAVLDYKVLDRHGARVLVEVKLLTGRYHQIRAQFAYAGFPIAGDKKYGATVIWPGQGIALHHREFVFPHPVGKENCRVQASYPKQWDEGWPGISRG